MKTKKFKSNMKYKKLFPIQHTQPMTLNLKSLLLNQDRLNLLQQLLLNTIRNQLSRLWSHLFHNFFDIYGCAMIGFDDVTTEEPNFIAPATLVESETQKVF